MRVAYCWMAYSGYMASCWRALHDRPGVDVHVTSYVRFNPGYKDDLMGEIPHVCTEVGNPLSSSAIAANLQDFDPDVVVVCGWIRPEYRKLVQDRALPRARYVMSMDTQWNGTIRQLMGKYRYRKFFKNIDMVAVASERSASLARALGFPSSQIFRGIYSFDSDVFDSTYSRRLEAQDGWPRRFLFLGRYESEKALDVLVDAYKKYRGRVSQPWGLTCSGSGSLSHLLEDVDGIDDVGFTQPSDLSDLMVRHGVFVLPSRYEPWGVAIAEAAGSGLPVICTTECGASSDLVHPVFNGHIIPPNNADALADAMEWCHANAQEIPTMGRRSYELSRPFTSTSWARRWEHLFKTLVSST